MLAKVADNFRPICPDFPMPETIIRPVHSSIEAIARSKSFGILADMISIAFALAFKTRLAISSAFSVKIMRPLEFVPLSSFLVLQLLLL